MENRKLVGDFDEIVEALLPGEKIIYGTASEKFHIIDETDRDYHTNFAFDQKTAKSCGKFVIAKILLALVSGED